MILGDMPMHIWRTAVIKQAEQWTQQIYRWISTAIVTSSSLDGEQYPGIIIVVREDVHAELSKRLIWDCNI